MQCGCPTQTLCTHLRPAPHLQALNWGPSHPPASPPPSARTCGPSFLKKLLQPTLLTESSPTGKGGGTGGGGGAGQGIDGAEQERGRCGAVWDR